MLQTPSRAVKALLDLADYFENLPEEEYDQTRFDHCICGHCNQRAGRVNHDTKSAAVELGLTYDQANQLFNGEAGRYGVYFMGLYMHTHMPTTKEAASCLRHIAITGEVPKNW